MWGHNIDNTKNIFMFPHWLHKHHCIGVLKRITLNFINIHLPKTSPYCDGFGSRTLFCFFSKHELVVGLLSPPQTQISKLWCSCDGSFSSSNVKLVLFPFPQLMQSLCYLCLYLLSKHEACFIFVSSFNVKFVLFSSFFQECLCCSSSHFPMMVHHLNHCKERHILLAGMHMSFARAYTNHLEREPMHPLHMRVIFAWRNFMHHKTDDTNFILNLGEKLSVIHPTLFSFLSIFL
jgi:hypothetical protein